MLGPGVKRRQQNKDQIDRLVVDRLKQDRAVEPRKDAAEPGQIGQFAMRNGNASADSGAAEPLAFGEHVVDLPLAAAGNRRGAAGNFLEGLLLARRPQLGDDASRREEVGDLHGSAFRPSTYSRAAAMVPKTPARAAEAPISHRVSRTALPFRPWPASSAGSIQPTLPSPRR